MAIFDLQKRVAFVTGGNGGIGLGMAKGLAAAGATVVIAGRNKAKAQSALSELHSLGAPAEFVELDVLKEVSCQQAIQRAVERFSADRVGSEIVALYRRLLDRFSAARQPAGGL